MERFRSFQLRDEMSEMDDGAVLELAGTCECSDGLVEMSLKTWSELACDCVAGGNLGRKQTGGNM